MFSCRKLKSSGWSRKKSLLENSPICDIVLHFTHSKCWRSEFSATFISHSRVHYLYRCVFVSSRHLGVPQHVVTVLNRVYIATSWSQTKGTQTIQRSYSWNSLPSKSSKCRVIITDSCSDNVMMDVDFSLPLCSKKWKPNREWLILIYRC